MILIRNYCENCGTKIRKDANFCEKCGKKIGESQGKRHTKEEIEKELQEKIEKELKEKSIMEFRKKREKELKKEMERKYGEKNGEIHFYFKLKLVKKEIRKIMIVSLIIALILMAVIIGIGIIRVDQLVNDESLQYEKVEGNYGFPLPWVHIYHNKSTPPTSGIEITSWSNMLINYMLNFFLVFVAYYFVETYWKKFKLLKSEEKKEKK